MPHVYGPVFRQYSSPHRTVFTLAIKVLAWTGVNGPIIKWLENHDHSILYKDVHVPPIAELDLNKLHYWLHGTLEFVIATISIVLLVSSVSLTEKVGFSSTTQL